MKTVNSIVVMTKERTCTPERGGKPYKKMDTSILGLIEDRERALAAITNPNYDISDNGDNLYAVVEEVSLNTVWSNQAPLNQTWFMFDKDLGNYVQLDEKPDLESIKVVDCMTLC